MKSLKEYLSRIGKSKGFGLQSPWAYDFVIDVITEQLPYYAYEELERKFSGEELKKQKLFFRIKNFMKRDNLTVFDINSTDSRAIEDFIESNPDCVAIVVEGIYCSDVAQRKWLLLRDSSFMGVTFDLYDFAICFLPTQLYKQHYKLNF